MGSLSANFGVRSEAEQARKFRSFSFSGRVTSFERRTTAYQCDQNENCETSNHFSISGNSYSSPDLLMDAKIAQECEAGFMKVNSGRTKQSPVYRTDASFASIFQPYYITCYYVKHMRRKRKATWKPQQ
ncbi:hypothetical protein T11_18006 [Trichinella zimbabwensis]|uniref:Uncharacterized protein n=1 Tax=Trichinella zimbabwensis TaxID=268475 RepID=A0A0V1HY27_9BILA|nr:hypothetical protein T11_18006 [Trichinella zimbabwensis]